MTEAQEGDLCHGRDHSKSQNEAIEAVSATGSISHQIKISCKAKGLQRVEVKVKVDRSGRRSV